MTYGAAGKRRLRSGDPATQLQPSPWASAGTPSLQPLTGYHAVKAASSGEPAPAVECMIWWKGSRAGLIFNTVSKRARRRCVRPKGNAGCGLTSSSINLPTDQTDPPRAALAPSVSSLSRTFGPAECQVRRLNAAPLIRLPPSPPGEVVRPLREVQACVSRRAVP